MDSIVSSKNETVITRFFTIEKKPAKGNPKAAIDRKLAKKKKYRTKLACCVKGCHSTSRTVPYDAKINFHTFPTDETLRSEWLKRAQPRTIVSDLRICSLHFSQRHTIGLRPVINRKSLPDLNLPPPEEFKLTGPADPLLDHVYWNPEQAPHPHSCINHPVDHDYSVVFRNQPEEEEVETVDPDQYQVVSETPGVFEVHPSGSPGKKKADAGKNKTQQKYKKILPKPNDGNDHQDQSESALVGSKRTYDQSSMGLKSTIASDKKMELHALLVSLDPVWKVYHAVRKHHSTFRIIHREFAIIESYLVELLKAAKLAEKANIPWRKLSFRLKMVFAVIHTQSFRGRDVLKKFLKYPTEANMLEWQQLLPFPRPGLNPSIGQLLKKVSDSFKPLNLYCSLTYGEMSIRRKCELDTFWDALGGFATLSDCSLKNARFVFVFMAQGLLEKWKIPVAFYFSNVLRSPTEITRMIKEVIDFLEQADLKVVATVSSTRLYNFNVVKELTGANGHYFEHNGRKIFTVFDPRFLVKSTRDLLFSKQEARVQFGTGVFADGNDIRVFFEEDSRIITRRLAPKLTEEFFAISKTDSKKELGQALQLFSNTVYSAMYARQQMGLPYQITETADFILVIDELFDSLNGSTLEAPEAKPCKSAIHSESKHREFWTDAADWVSKWRIISKFNNKRRKKVPCPMLWVITMRAVMGLWDVLEPLGYQCLNTAWLNQSPLEDFLEAIQKKHNNPSPFEFQKTFKSLMMSILAGEPKGEGPVLISPESLLRFSLQEVDTAIKEKRAEQPLVMPKTGNDFNEETIKKIYEECQKLVGGCKECLQSDDFDKTAYQCRDVFNNADADGSLVTTDRPIRLLQDRMKTETETSWFSCDDHRDLVINGFTQATAIALLRNWCRKAVKKAAIFEALKKKSTKSS